MVIPIAILLIAAGLTCFVCWIIVLVRLFQNNEIVHGVIGIICGLWAFIMGWAKSGQLGTQKIMLIWTLALAASIILQMVMAAITAGSQAGGY